MAKRKGKGTCKGKEDSQEKGQWHISDTWMPYGLPSRESRGLPKRDKWRARGGWRATSAAYDLAQADLARMKGQGKGEGKGQAPRRYAW